VLMRRLVRVPSLCRGVRWCLKSECVPFAFRNCFDWRIGQGLAREGARGASRSASVGYPGEAPPLAPSLAPRQG